MNIPTNSKQAPFYSTQVTPKLGHTYIEEEGATKNKTWLIIDTKERNIKKSDCLLKIHIVKKKNYNKKNCEGKYYPFDCQK